MRIYDLSLQFFVEFMVKYDDFFGCQIGIEGDWIYDCFLVFRFFSFLILVYIKFESNDKMVFSYLKMVIVDFFWE